MYCTNERLERGSWK